MAKPEEATSLVIEIEERPPLNTGVALGQVTPIKPLMRVAAIHGRRGTYEVGDDGDYYWRGWHGDMSP